MQGYLDTLQAYIRSHNSVLPRSHGTSPTLLCPCTAAVTNPARRGTRAGPRRLCVVACARHLTELMRVYRSDGRSVMAGSTAWQRNKRRRRQAARDGATGGADADGSPYGASGDDSDEDVVDVKDLGAPSRSK